MHLRKIVFLLLVAFFPFTTYACAREVTYEITATQERGTLDYKKTQSSVVWIIVDSKKDPDTEIYVNGKKLSSMSNHHEKITYSLTSLSSAYFPKSFDIAIKQNGIETYSAKWKITDTTYSLFENLSPYLLVASLFFSALFFILFLIGIFIDKFHRIKWFLLGSVIFDLIFLLPFLSSNC